MRIYSSFGRLLLLIPSLISFALCDELFSGSIILPLEIIFEAYSAVSAPSLRKIICVAHEPIMLSAMNYKKRGINKLLEMILRKQMKRLVITHKDRLLRFGSELVFSLCELQGIEIVIIHKGRR